MQLICTMIIIQSSLREDDWCETDGDDTPNRPNGVYLYLRFDLADWWFQLNSRNLVTIVSSGTIGPVLFVQKNGKGFGRRCAKICKLSRNYPRYFNTAMNAMAHLVRWCENGGFP